MNLELLDPFAQDFPEAYDSSIDAEAACAKFNPRGSFAGHYLAVGRSDGVVSVLDFETKGVVRWLQGHVQQITAICWSHNSRYLLSASRDWNVIIWDLLAQASTSSLPDRRDTVRFDAPVTSAHLHPTNSQILAVTLASQVEPVLVDLRSATRGRWELHARAEADDTAEEEEESTAAKAKSREISTICRFNQRGDLLYVGTSKGNINIWDVASKQFLWTESIGSAAIKQMEFDVAGTSLVLNSNDRCIRVVRLLASAPAASDDDVPVPNPAARPTPPPPARPGRVPWFLLEHKFQDLVNRTPWHGCGFSRNGECVMGGAGHKGAHEIHLWDRETGRLNKILEGPKDPCADLDWHPLRPVIASISGTGLIHVWVTPVVENWNSYAPGFEELDENREYGEAEDEFDIETAAALERRLVREQDRAVDILTLPAEADPARLAADEAYDEFVRLEPDGDDDEAFYPPPELEADYEEEPEPPVQDLGQNGGASKADDDGFVSEELAAPVEEVAVKAAKAQAKAPAKKKPVKRAKIAKSEEL